MSALSEQTMSDIGIAIEQACRKFPDGGSHDTRSYLLRRLHDAVSSGHSSLADLHHAAGNALMELMYAEMVGSQGDVIAIQ
jgi:hypothetical protein